VGSGAFETFAHTRGGLGIAELIFLAVGSVVLHQCDWVIGMQLEMSQQKSVEGHNNDCENSLVSICATAQRARKGAAPACAATWHRTSDGAVAAARPSAAPNATTGVCPSPPHASDCCPKGNEAVARIVGAQATLGGISQAACCPETGPNRCGDLAVLAESSSCMQDALVAACGASQHRRKPSFQHRAAPVTARRVAQTGHPMTPSRAGGTVQSPQGGIGICDRTHSAVDPGLDGPGTAAFGSHRQLLVEKQAEETCSPRCVQGNKEEVCKRHRPATGGAENSEFAGRSQKPHLKRKFVPPRTGVRA
jgi:hypothetical protein